MATIFTIGHSTRPIEEFIALLRQQNVGRLADIRSMPGSHHNPQYKQEVLAASLREAGIEYVYLPELGGLRKAAGHSENDAWRNKSFRNYADYMQTEGFKKGVEELLRLGEGTPTVIMCAEAVPWRCHRSLVGDALAARGVRVRDIISATSVPDHRMTPFAVANGTEITYPKSALEDAKE